MMVSGAVCRNPNCANATNPEIDQALKNWMRNPPDREGRRAIRKKGNCKLM